MGGLILLPLCKVWRTTDGSRSGYGVPPVAKRVNIWNMTAGYWGVIKFSDNHIHYNHIYFHYNHIYFHYNYIYFHYIHVHIDQNLNFKEL
jgi:hypothetical protein